MPLADAGNDGNDEDDSGSDSDTTSVATTRDDEADGSDDVSTCTLGAKHPQPKDLLCRCPPPEHWTPPDNQLGLELTPASPDVDSSPSDSRSAPELSEPEPEEPKPTPLSKEEKLNAFWKRYAVPWPRPREAGSSSESSDTTDSEEGSGDHLSSSTLRLSQCGKKPSVDTDMADGSDQSQKPSPESESSDSDSSSAAEKVEVEAFENAMKAKSNSKAPKDSLMTSSMSTLETPKCSKPES